MDFLETLSVTADRLAQESLQEPLLALPVYVLAGMLGSLFPCVYPLIPITAGFLQNRAKEGETRFKHPLVYWCGTILSYSVLGALAAAGGGAFNAFMQSGPVIVATGLLFVFLCFVMLDWVPLTWQTGDRLVQKAARHSGLSFTLTMGFVAGFIASACVAPALVAMLLFLAKNSAPGDLVYNVFYGSLLSSAFGVGIGTPLFLAGVLGSRLPRSGQWMVHVKYGFTVVIALVAAWQLQKGFLTLGYGDMDTVTILAGMAFLILAAVLGLQPPDREDRRALVRFIFALFFLAFGLGSVAGTLGSGQANRQTAVVSNATETTVPKEQAGNLTFYRDEPFALAKARKEGRPVFIDFYADWCVNCVEFGKLAQSDEDLNRALEKTVLLKIYDTDEVFAKYQNDTEYPELLIGLPFFLILNADGSTRWKTTNYRDTTGMIDAISAGG